MKKLFVNSVFIALFLMGCTISNSAVEPATNGSTEVENPASSTVTEDTDGSTDSTMEDASDTADTSGTVAADVSTEGREAVFPNPLIVYTKEGRFPGSPVKWTIYPTGRVVDGSGQEWQLPEAEVQAIFAAADLRQINKLQQSYGAADCADCTVHTITVYGSEEPQKIVYTQAEGSWPADLEPLLGAIDALVANLGE